MHTDLPDHYATLGLHRACTSDQIRTAYRVLARKHHPDLNGGDLESNTHTQTLNVAYETLGDPKRRRDYDHELARRERESKPGRSGRSQRNVTEELYLPLDDFLRGTTLTLSINDPANPGGAETYTLEVPPMTTPGARVRVKRSGAFAGGILTAKLKARPDFRFKPRGSDLRCDLQLSTQRARDGGIEMVRGLAGAAVRVPIPRGIGRGEIIRIPGEGLPKAAGRRGDLLVRVNYRVEVRIRYGTSL